MNGASHVEIETIEDSWIMLKLHWSEAAQLAEACRAMGHITFDEKPGGPGAHKVQPGQMNPVWDVLAAAFDAAAFAGFIQGTVLEAEHLTLRHMRDRLTGPQDPPNAGS